MDQVEFTCPHCEASLEAPSSMIGETNRCPSCNGLVTLVTNKQIIAGGILGVTLGLIAAWFDS